MLTHITTGVAIITDILDENEIACAEQLITSDLVDIIDQSAVERAPKPVKACLQSLRTDGPASISVATAESLGGRNRLELRGLPHGRFSWTLRTNPRVVHAYEVLHALPADQLCTSCDNAFFATVSSEGQRSNREWGHVDHNANDEFGALLGAQPDWQVYQGESLALRLALVTTRALVTTW